MVTSEVLDDEPFRVSYEIEKKERIQLLDAINEEMNSLLNNTWTLVRGPMSSRLISCKWIFKCKDGNLKMVNENSRQDWLLEALLR